jgi:hypothetical protein
MRRSPALVVLVVLGLLTLGLTNAALAEKKASGQDLFKEHCKPCHMEDSENGEYTPMTLIQDQWERFFDEQYEETHGSVIDEEHGGAPVTEVIGADELERIKEFAIEHAADSEHPMTCG